MSKQEGSGGMFSLKIFKSKSSEMGSPELVLPGRHAQKNSGVEIWDLKSISTLPNVKTEFDHNSKLAIIYLKKFREKCF